MSQDSTSFLGVLADIATKQLERENFSISQNGESCLRRGGEIYNDPEDTEVKIKNHLLQNLFGIQKEKLQIARDMLTSLSVFTPTVNSSQTRRSSPRVYEEGEVELYLGLASKKYFAKNSVHPENLGSEPGSNLQSERPSRADSGVCSATSPVGSDRLVIAEQFEDEEGHSPSPGGVCSSGAADTVCLYLPGPPHTNRVVVLRTSGRANDLIGVVRAPVPPKILKAARCSMAQDHNYALSPNLALEVSGADTATADEDCDSRYTGEGYVPTATSHKKILHSSIRNNGVSGVAAVSESPYVKIAPNYLKPKLLPLHGDGMGSLEQDNFTPVLNLKLNATKKATLHDGDNSEEKNLALKYIREIRLASTRSNHCFEDSGQSVHKLSPPRSLSQTLSPSLDASGASAVKIATASNAQCLVEEENNCLQEDQSYLGEEMEENMPQGDERLKDQTVSNPENKKKKRVLSCALCPQKIFTASASLLNHYRSHAGIKPYVCSDCGSSFTRQHSLNYHMLIHQNASRFSCETCGRRFRHPSHFKEHLRKHTGETPYTCSQCSTSFKTRNTYKRHLKARHYMLLTVDGIRNMTPQEILSMENASSPLISPLPTTSLPSPSHPTP